MKKHLNIIVKGRVQGVFYRAEALDKALSLGISGTVENNPDGTVYMEIEGEDETLKEFLVWCKDGPTVARVTEIISAEAPLKNISDFRIL